MTALTEIAPARVHGRLPGVGRREPARPTGPVTGPTDGGEGPAEGEPAAESADAEGEETVEGEFKEV